MVVLIEIQTGPAKIFGFTAGLVYALVAVGMTIIFGVLRAINFANGEYYMLGSFAAWWGIETWDMPYIISIPVAVGRVDHHAVANLDTILAVDGVDLVFIDQGDLS